MSPGDTIDFVREATDANFEQAIRSSRVVLVDCWAPWCGPCRMIAPVIEALARDYAGRAAFFKLNTDANAKVAEKLCIYSIPTLLLYVDGELAEEIAGAVPRQYIEAILAQFLK